MSSLPEENHLDLFIAVISVIMLVVLLIAVYIEMKYMRPKRREEIELALTKDDAYNALSSTTAVSASLRGMGKNTSSADALLVKAQSEYDRGDYVKAMATTKAARDLLVNAKDEKLFEEAPNPHDADAIEGDGEKEEKGEDKTVHDARQLPPNYLESKFLIETTKEELGKAKAENKEVGQAEAFLCESEKCFGAEDYSGAFRCCMKARRSLAGKPVEATSPTQTVVAELSDKDLLQEQGEVNAKSVVGPQGTAPSGNFMDDKCPVCKAPMKGDDNFCPKCGHKVVKHLKCDKCSSPLSSDDSFCRKCGARVD
ncbi:MAG: Double zinc ribbon [Methanomassiliicoccales archaeon PtaU1.Bin124]|nr:MAG: Double zinc ribbon [Methanomassiliicoccales archaeon PtaU1.Bin124]